VVRAAHDTFYSECYLIIGVEYAGIFGGLLRCNPSSRRYIEEEKKFLDVILAFSVRGFYDLADLKLGDLLRLPGHIERLSFEVHLPLPVVTPVKPVPERSLRSVGGTLTTLDFSHETPVQNSPPLPDVFASLDSCEIGVVALVEFIITKRPMTLVGESANAASALFALAQLAFNESHLPSPLCQKSSFHGVTRGDVDALLARISRNCNPAAARHRRSLVASINARKLVFRQQLTPPLPLSLVNQQYRMDRLIVDWHKIEKIVNEMDSDDDGSIDAPEWITYISSRKRKWRALLLRRAKDRDALMGSTTSAVLLQRWNSAQLHSKALSARHKAAPTEDELETSPRVKPFNVRCVANGHGMLSDEAAAGLRHIMSECLMSESSLPHAAALWLTLISREVPKGGALFSKTVLGPSFQRLHARDMLDLRENLAVILESHPEMRVYLAGDDSYYDKGECHVGHASYFDTDAREPRWIFMTIARGTDKSDEVNGKIDFKSFDELLLPPRVLGGFTADHAALGEGKVAAAEAHAAATARGLDAPVFTIYSADKPHKDNLNGKHRMEGASGVSGGLGDNHWRQFLHILRFVYLSDLRKTVAMTIAWVGEKDGPHTLVPPDPNAGRWLYVAKASERFIALRKLHRRGTGEPFVPNFFRYMSDQALTPNIRSNYTTLALMSVDPRVLTYTMFEFEYLNMVHQPALNFTFMATKMPSKAHLSCGRFLTKESYTIWLQCHTTQRRLPKLTSSQATSLGAVLPWSPYMTTAATLLHHTPQHASFWSYRSHK
jgi:hypothetical protein